MIVSYGTGQYSPSAAANEEHMLAVPYGWNGDGSRRIAVWCHSGGGLAIEPFSSGISTVTVMQAIVDSLGIPTISFDGQPEASNLAQHWGNDTAQSRLTDAIAFAQSQTRAKTDKVILLGVSMGGLLASNWARSNASKISALGVFYPAANLQAVHDGTGGAGAGGAASTETAYGGSLASFNAAVTAHDPAQNTAAYKSFGIPMKMWYSDSDTVVGTANQQNFANGIGSALQTYVMPGAGHADMSQ